MINTETGPQAQDVSTPRRFCLLLPGLGYGPDRSLLYFAGKLAASHGFTVRSVAYHDLPTGAKKDPLALAQALSMVVEQTEEAVRALCLKPDDRLVLAGKSVGTVGAMHSLAHTFPEALVILMTPLPQTFSDDRVPKRGAEGRGIVFHGLKDPWYPDSRDLQHACQALSLPLHVYEGANHSLETGDVLRDVGCLRDVMEKIDSLMISCFS